MKTKNRTLRWVFTLLFIGAVGYGAYRGYSLSFKQQADSTPAQPAAGGARGGRGGRGGARGGRGGAATAVIATTARKMDMPLYLSELGTVTASNTVTVRSRVDGQLVRVAYEEGQFVREGDLLAEIDQRPFEVQLAQAQGQLVKDQALSKDAQANLVRYQELVNRGVIPKQQYDAAIASVGQYQGAIQTDEALIANANLQMTYAKVTAPINGQIGLRLVDQGNIVRAADPTGIVVITQVQPISVLFSIPEDFLGDVRKKLAAGQRLRVEAWDHNDAAKIAEGTLLTADNQSDPNTGTSRLKAVFENKNNSLFPNQFVNVKLLIDVLKNAVVVPAATIQRGTQGTYVYVVRDDHTAEMRPITLKTTQGSDAAIDSGLKPGEVVILEGMDKVQDGAKLDVQAQGNATPQAKGAAGAGEGASRGERGARGGGRGGRGGRGQRGAS